jgi:serine/threonine protein kinase
LGTTLPSQVKDPAALPAGMQVGEWRVVSWGGRGAYGTVYRVARLGRENEEHFALKLALRPRDERFEREAELLSRIEHPNIPRLESRGVWQHPAGNFPYLVMQWVQGETLYEWAARRNPTSRQVLRVLAQMAWAIEAIAKAGGLHRDVKGDNILVRVSDERAFLTDFGAGVYKGAKTLTVQPLAPGTPNYRSPEAWATQRIFAAHPSYHYPGSVCDELFALGVTAYRLVTDEYPPPTEPEQPGAEVWQRRGPGPRPPRELNPNVSEELNQLIMRLLASPERRFKGSAQRAGEALEQAAASPKAEADARLFAWEAVAPEAWTREERRHAELHGHRLRLRDKASVQRIEQQDAAARAEAARATQPHPRPAPSRNKLLRWVPWVVPSLAGIGLVVRAFGPKGEYAHQPPLEEPAVARAEERDGGTPDGGSAGAAEEALTAPSSDPAVKTSWGRVAAPMPSEPLPGQRRPPCNRNGEVELRGGCWIAQTGMEPPCDGFSPGGQIPYAWGDGCYLPSYPPRRQPTSDPP